MNNLLKEEINQIQYLFGYKKGVVISEQSDPIISKKIQVITNMKNNETDTSKKDFYDQLIDYYKKIQKGESPESPNKQFTDYIDSKYTAQSPTLPKAETADLGNLVGDDLTSAYNVLIGYFSGSKDFDGMAAFSTLLNNRTNQISMSELQGYLDKHTSIKLNDVYANITDKQTLESKGKNINPK